MDSSPNYHGERVQVKTLQIKIANFKSLLQKVKSVLTHLFTWEAVNQTFLKPSGHSGILKEKQGVTSSKL